MRRRDLLAALPAALAIGGTARAQTDVGALVRRQALELSARPFQPPPKPLPSELARLDYDGYRSLRFRPEMAVWRDTGLPFQLQMFPRGGLFQRPVELYEVVDGEIAPIAYRPELFTSGRVDPATFGPDLGFAGFRIHTPINDPSRFDEFAVFLGASYFRAVSKGTVYGLSARGLELGSGEPNEEFPAFRAFWIERPLPGATSIVVHALLDGPSVAGAYRFLITPGETTVFEVSASLIPRRSLKVGVAPLTSMFLFGTEQPRRFDDFRPEVHDSDGLLVARGDGEQLWRPLANPARVGISGFPDQQPGGFGLLQRQRDLDAYQDLEAHYHRRPGAWVEPLEGWTPGAVTLAELPARSEGEDNIMASWRPTRPLEPHREHRIRYRLHWAADPAPSATLARATIWRVGESSPGKRRFIVEFGPLDRPALQDVTADIVVTTGTVRHPVIQPNPTTGAARLSFEFDPRRTTASRIEARLVKAGQPVSETWTHRWLA